MATHVPQSLPSFAQAFSNTSLSNIPSGNALPPIQSISSSSHRFNSPRLSPDPSENSPRQSRSRKRSRTDEEPSNSSGSPHQSPIVKDEHDMLESTPPPAKVARLTERRGSTDSRNVTPTPSGIKSNVPKKRPMTGADGIVPHPLNTDLGPPSAEQVSTTPISPVVMGFTVRDDPAAIEQVRSTLNVKQKQKALIEQRRGSMVGPASNVNHAQGVTSSGNNHVGSNAPAVSLERDGIILKPTAATRSRRSPNPVAVSSSARRGSIVLSGPGGPVPPHPRAPSPSPVVVPSQVPPSQSLPPPPISFARRRAGQLGSGKKKPADIVISPREAHTAEQFQPSIQSAPPIPHGGQSTGRFPMTLPRLPSVMGPGESVRRVSIAQVPPTPTRFSVVRGNGSGAGVTQTANTSSSGLLAPPRSAGLPRKSPPPSIPISNTLVPPTPSSLHHPGYSGDKSAFFAPFEIFYDALNDSKQLKNWLGEQLQKSNTLMQNLTQQQEKMDELVEKLVERKLRVYREENAILHKRVGQLEDTLRRTVGVNETSARRGSVDIKGHHPARNGIPPGPVASEAYTFPPVEQYRVRSDSSARRLSSPGWRNNERESQGAPESENGSPAPFDVHRRMSTSAIRLDPPMPPPESSSSRPPVSTASQGLQGPGNRPLATRNTHIEATTSPQLAAAHASISRTQTDRSLSRGQHSHASYKLHSSNASDSSPSPRLGSDSVRLSPRISNHQTRKGSIASKSPPISSPPRPVMEGS